MKMNMPSKEERVKHYQETGLTVSDFRKLLCEKISEVTNRDFPCFCGIKSSKYREFPERLSSDEIVKAFDILECLELLEK